MSNKSRTFQPLSTRPVTRAGTPLTAADIAAQKIDHDELLRQYNECQAVEAALRHQIIDAIDDETTVCGVLICLGEGGRDCS